MKLFYRDKKCNWLDVVLGLAGAVLMAGCGATGEGALYNVSSVSGESAISDISVAGDPGDEAVGKDEEKGNGSVNNVEMLYVGKSGVSVRTCSLPEQGWQKELTFPDPAGYTDDTLVMNATAGFTAYRGQGTIYIHPSEELESYRLFIDHTQIDIPDNMAGGTLKVDFGNISDDGMNELQITDIQPAGASLQVYIPYPEVIGGMPEDVGIDPAVLKIVDEVMTNDVNHGFSAAQMAVVKDGKLVYRKAWGLCNSYNEKGERLEGGPRVNNDTLFDLASNTKMYAGAYAVQYLVSQGLLTMDTKISDILGERFYQDTIDITYYGYDNPGLLVNKEWKKDLTIRDVMCHQAGFPASPAYFKAEYDQGTMRSGPGLTNVLYAGGNTREEVRKNTLDQMCRTPLMYKPGSKVLYSDADYMLIAFCVEAITGRPLEEFLQNTFWGPMGLEHICFNPLERGFDAQDCAATELMGNSREGKVNFQGVRTHTIQGEVHDEIAYYAMNGVSGHAGLFANATDLAKLASVMLTGGYGESRFFSKEVMDAFTAPQEDALSNWGVGWYRQGDGRRAYYFSQVASRDTVGHQGWTGTLTAIDPEENLVVVLLTNKINTPLTDKEENVSKFDGNWYTASTLGFAVEMVYEGFMVPGPDAEASRNALLSQMVQDKLKLVNAREAKLAENGKSLTSEDAIVQAMYSLLEVYLGHQLSSGEEDAAAVAWDMLDYLDPIRDEQELLYIYRKYPAFWQERPAKDVGPKVTEEDLENR